MSACCAIGIDIGGTNIKAVRVDADGQVQQRLDTRSSNDSQALIVTVRDLVGQLTDEDLANGNLTAEESAEESAGEPSVGVASPGLAATDNRCIRWMRGRMEAVEGLVWAEALEGICGKKAVVLNDAHAATLGEAWVGAAAGLQHVVMLTLGTGVGGGVICGGQLMQGAAGRAGHVGHITLDLDGPTDILQTPGSLEDLVGNHTVEARTGFTSTADLVAAAMKGDARARQHWDRALHALACGVVSLINVFDPQAVVIGGGIARAGQDALFRPLQKKLDDYEWRPLGPPVPILPATLGEWSGAVGAARFAMTQTTSTGEKH